MTAVRLPRGTRTLPPEERCGWCECAFVWTVTFDTCDHAVPVCDEHYLDYFRGVGWERYYEREEDFDPTCPDCAG